MDKYPFYYEVKQHEAGEEEINEGGIILAVDHSDAMKQLAELYEPGIVSITIEYLKVDSLVFSIDKARELKEWVNTHALY